MHLLLIGKKMNRTIFNNLIQNPKQDIPKLGYEVIEDIQRKFPYCEIIHTINLLKAFATNRIDLEEIISKTAIYSSNRSDLFHLIYPKKTNTINVDHLKSKQEILFEEWLKKPILKQTDNREKLIKNKIQKSVEDNTNLTTETLANIYIQQGHYERAIKAYEVLCLKYPKKSGFFADQINKLKKKLK